MTTELLEPPVVIPAKGVMDFDILRSAINQARNCQFQSVQNLKHKLIQLYPGRELDIDASLVYWANYAAKNNH